MADELGLDMSSSRETAVRSIGILNQQDGGGRHWVGMRTRG